MVLTLTCFVGVAAQAEWVSCAELAYPTGNLTYTSTWDPRAGLKIRMRAQQGPESLTLTLKRKRGGLALAPKTLAAEHRAARGAQFFAEHLPTEASDAVRVELKLRPQYWSAYVDGELIAVCAAPFLTPIVVEQEAETADVIQRVRYQKVKLDEFAFTDNFLIEEDAENMLSAWEQDGGSWELHASAKDRLVANKGRVAKKGAPQAQRSPNFYSLLASGTNAVMSAGHFFFDDIDLRAAVRMEPGEAGLVFHYEDAETYHAFTVTRHPGSTRSRFALWRTAPDTGRERIAAADTELTDDQWMRLRVRSHLNRVQCFVDHTCVIDVETRLSAGGRIGLFVDAADGVRFDDVALTHNDEPPLDREAALQRQVYATWGKVKFTDAAELRMSGGSQAPAVAFLGSAHAAPPVVSAVFTSDTETYTVGFIAGYVDAQTPYFRLSARHMGAAPVFALERVSPTSTTTLERSALPALAPGAREATLMLDTSEAGVLRFYAGGRLVLIHHLEAPLLGGTALFVGADTPARVADLRCLPARDDTYRNRYEKNQVFAADQYMRNWSSPEGEWITMPSGLTWHKGDFYTRYSMTLPMVKDSTVHLGVGGVSSNGAIQVSIEDDAIAIRSLREDGAYSRPLAAAALSRITRTSPGKEGFEAYTVDVEDYWLWVRSGGEVLFKHNLVERLAGRRVRVEGFKTEDLAKTSVARYSVKDYLFTESLHEWTKNGGKWEVVNRFQCDPRWSHMNGESADTLAALWGKYAFAGDFCVELYAGMRHGWYDRAGDLNITMLSDQRSPSSGYTVTTTGWDFDRSQVMTRLYRNGEILEQSDKYLVPRRREGMKRAGYNPLLPKGRDLHGAWYYLKFRRSGDRLEYYFDNELVFAVNDPNPLTLGGMGCWTYCNSMMVARIRIGAEQIVPREIAFAPVSTETTPDAAPDLSGIYGDVTVDARPRAMTIPAHWRIDDPVGHSRLSWHVPADEAPYFVVRNTLGGGDMFAACTLPPTPYTDLAGWRLYLKRTANAAFNVHYSLGTVGEDESYTPLKHFFHHVSGTRFGKGEYLESGTTPVAAAVRTDPAWHEAGAWTPVDVWLEARALGDAVRKPNLHVRLEGIGTRQQSFVAQGLRGNRAGDAYAVSRVHAIRYGDPDIAATDTNAVPEQIRISAAPSGTQLVAGTVADVAKWLEESGPEGLVRGRLITRHADRELATDLAWVRLPSVPRIEVRWSDTVPGQIEFDSQTPYPDRRFLLSSVATGGSELPLHQRDISTLTAFLPRGDDYLAVAGTSLSGVINSEGRALPFRLGWDAKPNVDVPVLLGLGDSIPVYLNFEHRQTSGGGLGGGEAKRRLGYGDAAQGSYLTLYNGGVARKLRVNFAAKMALARYPLAQFRYRGTGMVNVSMALRSGAYVKLSKDNPKARAVRHADPLVLDGSWQTWWGMATDALGEGALGAKGGWTLKGGLGSYAGVDQTGLFSEWDIDDVIFGPAVNAGAGLRLRPRYFDRDGVTTVAWAVSAAAAPYTALDDAQRTALVWTTADHGSDIQPVLDDVAEGVGRLFVRATDARGGVSAVTDIPFLLDRTAPEADYAFEPATGPMRNGTVLNVVVKTGGAAPTYGGAVSFAWRRAEAETPHAVGATQLRRSAKEDSFVLNWPYLFREQINAMAIGETNHIVVAGIEDGAGNSSGACEVPVVIDPSADKTPPTLCQISYSSNFLWCSSWGLKSLSVETLRPDRSCSNTLKLDAEHGAYLAVRGSKPAAGTYATLSSRLAWDVRTHPHFAMRIRVPANETSTNTLATLHVTSASKRKHEVPLNYEMLTRKALVQSAGLELGDGKWHSYIVDMRALLNRATAAKDGKKAVVQDGEAKGEASAAKAPKEEDLIISTLRVTVKESAGKGAFDLQDLSIFADYAEHDEVAIEAFDVTGIAAYEANMVAVTTNASWIVARAVDRAGHYSPPVRFPTIGAEKPKVPSAWTLLTPADAVAEETHVDTDSEDSE